MAAAPSYVAVKRKREDAPIQSLILEERRTKHARVNVEYRLKSVSQLSNEQPSLPSPTEAPKRSGSSSTTPGSAAAASRSALLDKRIDVTKPPVKHAGPRQFELAPGKRSADAAGFLPTFIERPAKRTNVGDEQAHAAQRGTPQKRPGTRRAQIGQAETKILGKSAEPSATLAARLNAFAIEEAGSNALEEREKPRVIVQPKRTIRRPKAPAPSAPPFPVSDAPMTDSSADEKDYVYDIYIRSEPRQEAGVSQQQTQSTAKAPGPPAAPSTQPQDPTAPRSSNLISLNPDSTAPRSLLDNYTTLPSYDPSNDYGPDVGYLILPSDSQSQSEYFWTSSTSRSPSRRNMTDKGIGPESDADDTEDEDSNAEDYYGADYPEDEVDEDDEMGVGEWRFRRGSEGEDDFEDPGWAGRKRDEDGWSDDSLEEDRMVNPWRRYGGRE